jgi:transposase
MSNVEQDYPIETTVFASLELSKASWLLAIHAPERVQPSLYLIKGGDCAMLFARLDRAVEQRKKRGRRTPRIVVCYEAGFHGFWLARLLEERGITCFVMDSTSLEVNRRARRAKTDRLDAAKLLRTLIAWCRGERHVCSMVRVPTRDEEDSKRSHRERSRLIRERTAHVNRIKGLLFTFGVRDLAVKRRYDKLPVDELVAGDGYPLPPRIVAEVKREIERLMLVQQQIGAVEAERDAHDERCPASEAKRQRLIALRGIGPTLATILTREVYYRSFDNRRQVGSYIGLAPTPHDSGGSEHCHGISRAGNGPVRSVMIEAAWLWLKHQPQSRLSQWYQTRTVAHTGRVRRTMVVALARKLAVALWRYVERGVVPDGAICAASPR